MENNLTPFHMLPETFDKCFKLPIASIEDLKPGKTFFVVYAYGAQTILRRLVFKGVHAFEYLSPSGQSYFVILVQCLDEHATDLNLNVEDFNLNFSTSAQYTNNFCFVEYDDADWYAQHCREFNIPTMRSFF